MRIFFLIIILISIILFSFSRPAAAAVEFSGGRAYIEISHHPDLDVRAPLTVAGWIKKGQQGEYHSLVWQRSNQGRAGWALCIENSEVIFAPFGIRDFPSKTRIGDLGWHHIAVVVKPRELKSAASTFPPVGETLSDPNVPLGSRRVDEALCWTIYIDGNKDNAGCGIEQVFPANTPLYIGARTDINGAPDRFSDVVAAEIAIWDIPLSEEHMRRVAQARGKNLPLKVEPRHLKLFLPLSGQDQGEGIHGKIFPDQSGHGHDGLGFDAAGGAKIVKE